MDDLHSVASAAISKGGLCPNSIFTSITESDAATTGSRSNGSNTPRKTGGIIKRDAGTAMYIFERLLAKIVNPELSDRVHVINRFTDIASATFSGKFSTIHKIDHPDAFSDAMDTVFARHSHNIYLVVLEMMFRPVREADANRIGVFSFQEAAELSILAGLIRQTVL